MNRSDLSKLQIVVLAAGYSTRMGRSKALMKIHGVSLIRRTLMVLAPFAANPVVIVAPPRAQRLRNELRTLPVRFLTNPARARGLSSSVSMGLRASRFRSAILLVPVDLAELASRDIARLITHWRSARRRLIARELSNGAATPLILPRSLYPRPDRLVGDVGLRQWLTAIPGDAKVLLELPSANRDADTLEELREARRAARFRSGATPSSRRI